MSLKSLRVKYNKLDLNLLVDECINETSEIIIDLVRSQIESGETSVGMLPPLKNPEYAARKQAKGSLAPQGITDLKDSGDFLRRLVIKKYQNNILVRSFDWKNSLILKKYGLETYLLNEKNLKYYIDQVFKPLLLKKIKS